MASLPLDMRSVSRVNPLHIAYFFQLALLSEHTLCLKKNVLTLKRYSSKLQGAILMKFGRNIQNTLE